MDKKIAFGTDGWRGLLGDEVNTAKIGRVAQAFADFIIHNNKNKKVVIGYDGRLHSTKYAREFAEVLSANDIAVLLSDRVVPTPVVSYTCRAKACGAGVMITASHNPPTYNGVKFKTALGSPFHTEDTARVESLIDKNKPEKSSKNIITTNLLQNYCKHLEQLIDFESIREAGLYVAIDSMAGAGRTLLEDILLSKGITAKTIFSESTPNFSGRTPEPIAANLKPLTELLENGSFSLGLATDGDADRIGVMTDKGKWMNIQECILYLADYYINKRNIPGAVVKTASVTEKLKNICNSTKTPLFDAPVGFKYVAESMIENNAAFGAEESGGFGFKEHVPDRDGILTGLLLLEMLAQSGHNKLEAIIDEKRKVHGHVFYDRIDIKNNNDDRHQILPALSAKPPTEIVGFGVIKVSSYTNSRGLVNGLKFYLEGSTRWLLIRVSETEPIVRIYAEGESPDEVKDILNTGKQLINDD